MLEVVTVVIMYTYYRPNPIGVTLARIDRVCKKTRTIYLRACDLVHGTPVLDVKVTYIVTECSQCDYYSDLNCFNYVISTTLRR